jgi:WD40 repeat protein
VAFSADGKYIVTASRDSTVRIWDSNSGKTLQILHPATAGVVNSAAFSPDGNYVVTASDHPTPQVWNWRAGTLVGVAH